MRAPLLFFAAALASACGPRPPDVRTVSASAPSAGLSVIKMRHQIAFRRGDDAQVFDGYMLLAGDKLLVRAFAGPGVDLFTVVRDGAAHRETLHIPGLADRIDMAAVGADIARVYLGGCAVPAGGGESSCDFYGEPMNEAHDAAGRLVSRGFPEAHDIGLTVTYEHFTPCAGAERAGDVTLRWGESANSMTIHLAACEPLESVDPAVFSAR